MIQQNNYRARRECLMDAFADSNGVIFLRGNSVIQKSPDIDDRFRQNSYLRYLTGADMPDAAMLLVPEEQKYILFAPKSTSEDEVWTGRKPTQKELKRIYGADEVHYTDEIDGVLKRYNDKDFYTLPHHVDALSFLGFLARHEELVNELIEMRLHKTPEEIREIEKALAVTADAYDTVMRVTRAGIKENRLTALMEYIFASSDSQAAFPPIITIEGGVLHGWYANRMLTDGKMLLVDAGAEVDGYAADVTRTFPVNGKFSPEQRELYNVVLRAKKEATDMMRPGINFRDVHMRAERVIAEGLRDYGILKGNIDSIMENGAHRLFFPHGLGHSVGLDVHDCGDFPDIVAGYSNGNPRSKKFGLDKLRFARRLEAGHVLTVEPGIYFIKGLLNNAEMYRPYRDFINLEKARQHIHDVSGIRIEDDVLVTEDGHRTLGQSKIPEECDELEKIVGIGGIKIF